MEHIQKLKYQYPLSEHNELFDKLEFKEIYIQNTWLVIPKRLLKLLNDFVEYKTIHGSDVEKELYCGYKGVLIKRLFEKRALTFTGTADSYNLRDGTTSGVGGWETIGTDHEQEPLVLKDYISYDEIELSAFITLSCFTPFINNGSRHNCGRQTMDRQPNGVYMGQVGARFQKHQQMEWRYMMIDPKQNTVENGYGPNNTSPKGQFLSIWANFYGVDYFPTYEEAKNNPEKYCGVRINNICYINTIVYKERMKINALVYLKEANHRARTIDKHAFCHIVGLGLGVWAVSAKEQQRMSVEAYLDLLHEHKFPRISDLYFAWFKEVDNDIEWPDEIAGIKIHFGTREPADPLNDPNKLLVANWAWDANSYVGNEYWEGFLSSSGDPAAACCSFVSYFGNPELCTITKVHTW